MYKAGIDKDKKKMSRGSGKKVAGAHPVFDTPRILLLSGAHPEFSGSQERGAIRSNVPPKDESADGN
jgi:hypothetical protein